MEQRLDAIERRLEAAEECARGGASPRVVAASALTWGPDAHGKGTAAVGPDGSTFLVLTRPTGEPGMALGVGPHGHPSLWMADKSLRKRLDVQLATNDCPRVCLMDPAGAIRLDCSVDPRGAPTIALQNAKSEPACALLVNVAGLPGLGFAPRKVK